MAVGSSLLATVRSAPPQWPHVLTSMLKTCLRRCAQVIERRFWSGLRSSLLAPVDSSSAGGRLPRPDCVSYARNFAFGVQIRPARICQVERAAEALDQRHRAALRAGALDARLDPPASPQSRDARSPAPGRWLRACWRTGSVTALGHSAATAAPAAGRTHLPRDAAHSRPRAARRSWGKTTRLAGKRQQPLLRPLPYALRASLRLFKFVPDEFVRMALLAHHAQEAVLEHAAAQERLELLAHAAVGDRSETTTDGGAPRPRDAETPLANVRSALWIQPALPRPSHTRQAVRKGRLKFLYFALLAAGLRCLHRVDADAATGASSSRVGQRSEPPTRT